MNAGDQLLDPCFDNKATLCRTTKESAVRIDWPAGQSRQIPTNLPVGTLFYYIPDDPSEGGLPQGELVVATGPWRGRSFYSPGGSLRFRALHALEVLALSADG